jgi:hypothetical protein
MRRNGRRFERIRIRTAKADLVLIDQRDLARDDALAFHSLDTLPAMRPSHEFY